MAELSPYGVRAGAGSLRAETDTGGVLLQHTWTPDGVLAAPVANGAHALHLAVALCVLNDVYREAGELGVPIAGVAVEADGGFDPEWTSTGIGYRVEVDSPAEGRVVEDLIARVHAAAEIPRALRAGVAVEAR